MPILADKYNCTGCLACIDVCSKNALSAITDDEGHYFYCLDNKLCVECRKCENVCPALQDEYHYGNNDLSKSIPFAAWCTIKSLRLNSTSGGVFAAIAHKILSQDGIVIGASIQNNKVQHIAIDEISELHSLQGSKYAQSFSNGIYRKTLTLLKEGKYVLFSGTGCQVAALYNFLPKSLNTDKLFTIDLVCGGVPSNYLIERFLRENNRSVDSIVGFRNKANYEFSVLDKKGNVKIIPLSERPLPLCGFYWEMTNRFCCYNCHFAHTHRKADLTIGDLWGDRRFLDQHEDGISLVIAHSAKGVQLLSESEIVFSQVKWQDILPYNTRIAYGKNLMCKTNERKRLSVAFQNYSYQHLLDDYANNASIKRPISILKKAYRILLITINHRKSEHYIKRLLSRV